MMKIIIIIIIIIYFRWFVDFHETNFRFITMLIQWFSKSNKFRHQHKQNWAGGGGGGKKGERKNTGNTLNGDYPAVHTDLTLSVSWQYLFASVKFLCENHVKNSTYLSQTAKKRNNLSQKTDPPLSIH